jgi:hypothetical protein
VRRMSAPDRRFPDDVPLGQARAWLRQQVADKGARCPCCTQLAKIYTRRIRGVQAEMLIKAWRLVGLAEFRRPKLRYWGLIDDLGERREDGGKAGWYAITELGAAWVRNLTKVPRDALVYDSRLLRLDQDSPSWSVRDALGDKFDYDKLMDIPGGEASAL